MNGLWVWLKGNLDCLWDNVGGPVGFDGVVGI